MMQSLYNAFLKKLFLTTIVIFILGAALFYFVFLEYYLAIFPFLLLFIATITWLIYFILKKGVENKSPQVFSTYFMGATGAKLLLFVAFFVVYLMVTKQHIVVFSMVFLVLYIVYTIFEVFELIKLVKHNQKQK